MKMKYKFFVYILKREREKERKRELSCEGHNRAPPFFLRESLRGSSITTKLKCYNFF